MYENLPIISVSQFNQYIGDMISQVKFAVRGEVSGYKVSQGKWVTFELKDEGSRVACFTTTFKQNLQIEDGMEIICYGSPRIYVPYGKYSFNIDLIEVVGEGALQKAFELTKKKLESEGLFKEEYKKKLPVFPKKIGLITSETAAAYTDVLRILKNRWSGLEIFLKPSLVQGVNAPSEICEAIEFFNKHLPVDVIILTRGGGSLEDLQAFNDENVARAVFASNIPIVSAVGHERDITLVDYVSDLRASTPSNAAERVVPDKDEMLRALDFLESNMFQSINKLISQISQQLDNHLARMEQLFNRKISSFNAMEQKLLFLGDKLTLGIKQKEEKLNSLENLLNSLNPLKVLERGYSISYDAKTKKVLMSAKDLKWGDKLVTQFKDGKVQSIVESNDSKN